MRKVSREGLCMYMNDQVYLRNKFSPKYIFVDKQTTFGDGEWHTNEKSQH